MRSVSIFFLMVLVLSSCKREFLNPYDSQTPPDVWMPVEFAHSITGGNGIELSWKQPNELIDGFTILKRKNGIENAIELDKSARTYQDNIVLDSAEMSVCTAVSYSIFARAGVQKSKTASLPSELFFPQPSPANAGFDIFANTLTLNLTASIPANLESGKWTILSGVGGVIANVDAYNSLFTGKTNQTYILNWEITSCNAVSSDQIIVTYPISLSGNGVTDIDGNIYATQIIGEQEWVIENLKTTRYRNGELIPNESNPAEWTSVSGVWCNYNNSIVNDAIYGKLYNWFAVADPRGLCPDGWHVPSDTEWTELIDYLGGPTEAGGKMKALSYWESPNVAASNQSNFSSHPGGLRFNTNGNFTNLGLYGYWWSSSESSTSNAWTRLLYYNNGVAYSYDYVKTIGLSVRCIKD